MIDDKQNPEKINRIEEKISIQKETVETGKVVITSSIEEQPFNETVALNVTSYDIQRIPKDEFIDSPNVEIYEDEFKKVIPVIEEVVVVEKRYKLVEEIHIIKKETTVNETISDSVKKQKISISKH